VRQLLGGFLGGASELTVLDKLTYAGSLTNLDSIPNDAYRFVLGDICDQSIIATLIRDNDVVVNFAAESHVDRSISNPSAFIDTNIRGTQTILDEIKNYSSKRFLQISTDEVYGSVETGSWTEDSPLLPNSPYSASKAAADLISRSYFKTYGLDIRITRSSNNYGPYQFPEKLIPLAITNILRGKRVPVYGTGLNVRDWLHIDDNCEAIHKALLNGQPGEIYNIGGGNEVTNLQIVKSIMNILGVDEQEYIEFVPDRKGHDLRYSVDTTKTFTHLGISPKVDFFEGLKQTVSWYVSNEIWWAEKVIV